MAEAVVNDGIRLSPRREPIVRDNFVIESEFSRIELGDDGAPVDDVLDFLLFGIVVLFLVQISG